MDYSVNGRIFRATFCFISICMLCRPMSGVFQRPSWWTPECQVELISDGKPTCRLGMIPKVICMLLDAQNYQKFRLSCTEINLCEIF